MRDLERYEQARRGQNDQGQDYRLGRGRSDVADDDLKRGNGSRQELIYRTHELWEKDAKRRVGDALRQQRQHDQPGHYEGAVADPLDIGDARAYRCAEDDEIQGCRDHGRDDALQQRTPSPRHLELVDSTNRVKVHSLSFTRSTKISSSELCFVCRSFNLMPAPLRSASKAVMPVRSVCVS